MNREKTVRIMILVVSILAVAGLLSLAGIPLIAMLRSHLGL